MLMETMRMELAFRLRECKREKAETRIAPEKTGNERGRPKSEGRATIAPPHPINDPVHD